MAKVPFTKLGLSKNQNVKTIEWNSQIIEIKQYLSIAEKLQIISNILNIEGNYELFIRKALGHLSFFLTLAIFASVV